jgi:hypothetical protein
MVAGDLDPSFDGNGKKTVDFGGEARSRSALRSSPTA